MTGFINSDEYSQLCDSYGIASGNGDWSNCNILCWDNCSRCGADNVTIADFVERLYNICLEREPEEGGLTYWTTQLANGEDGSWIAYGFIFSDEYKDKHTSNTEYVTMLYRTMMDREPDEEGLAYWVEKLDYTNTREHVFNGFLFSTEFVNRCTACGINVGSEIPTLDDSAEWQMNIQILALCNEQRVENGVAALKTRQDLWEQVAMVRVAELPDYFSHTRPDGTTCYTAYTEAGIRSSAMAENIAAGQNGAEAVVNSWMNSSGHRLNILSAKYTYLATGYISVNTGYRLYYCQNFAYYND